MWFLWFIITFIVVITSGSQITKIVINKNMSNAKATIIVSAVIVVAWLIISLAVDAIREQWSALLVGWVLGLVGTGISFKLNKDKAPSNDWNSKSFEEKRQEAREAVTLAKRQMEAEGIDVDGEMEKFCDDFNRKNKLGKYKENTDTASDSDDEFTVDKNRFEELLEDLPIEIDESDFDDEWHEELCVTLQDLVEETATKNPTFKVKTKFTLADIDMLIGMSFCCIKRKPANLCQDLQNAIKDRAKNSAKYNGTQKDFSLNDIKTLIKMGFANLRVKKDTNALMELAEQGDVEAQRKLAFKYATGQGVEHNFDKEVYWLKKAIEQGCTDAMHSLALRYTVGGGANIHKDMAEAYKWAKKAAKLGNSNSIDLLRCPEFAGLETENENESDESDMTEEDTFADLDYLEQEYDFQRNRVQQLLKANHITVTQTTEYRRKIDETFNIARDLMSNKKHMNPVFPQLENLDYYADIVDFSDTATYCKKLRTTLAIEVEEMPHNEYGYTIAKPIWLSRDYHLWRNLFDVGGKYHTHSHSYGMVNYYFDSITPIDKNALWKLKKFFEVDLEKGAEEAHPFAEMRTRYIGVFECAENGNTKLKIAELYFDTLGFDLEGLAFPTAEWFSLGKLPAGFRINK